jgi:peptide/nickel transport system permease protein
VERLSWYILRRLLVVAIGVLVILTAEFCLFRVLPDDPVRLAAPPWPSGVPNDISEQYAEVIDMFEQPLYVQYFQFIGDMLTGDFGFSFLHKSDVSDYVYSAMWRTLILFGASLSLCLIIGSLAARAMSMIKSYFVKRTLFFASLALFSLPVAAWQWFLQRYLSLEWGLLPSGGIAPLDSSGIHLKYLIMPLATVFLASIGGFILSIRDGQTKASTAMSPERSTLRDGLFAALPNIQFMVAASILFVACAEWWFEYPGLVWNFMNSLYPIDYFWLQASFFLLAMMVFMVNFSIETVVTLIRPRRRIDQCLRKDEDQPRTTVEACVRTTLPQWSFRRIKGALIRVVKEYLRSPVGVLSLLVFIAIAVLAMVGPWLSSGEIVSVPAYQMKSSADLFLDGASALVAIPVLAGLIGSLIGMALGTIAGYSRPYADGIVMAIMQGVIAIPFLGLVVIMRVTRSYGEYFDVALACSVPIIALVTLLSFHGFVSSRSHVAATECSASKWTKFLHSAPAVGSWALSGLKYGMSITVVTVFVCDFWRLTNFSSWGYAFRMAVNYSFYEPIEWEYILPPLIGSALLIGSIFLILDTIERVIRTRFSELA